MEHVHTSKLSWVIFPVRTYLKLYIFMRYGIISIVEFNVTLKPSAVLDVKKLCSFNSPVLTLISQSFNHINVSFKTYIS